MIFIRIESEIYRVLKVEECNTGLGNHCKLLLAGALRSTFCELWWRPWFSFYIGAVAELLTLIIGPKYVIETNTYTDDELVGMIKRMEARRLIYSKRAP